MSPDTVWGARLVAGLMTGIGFIGGGAILEEADHVRGTSTAATDD